MFRVHLGPNQIRSFLETRREFFVVTRPPKYKILPFACKLVCCLCDFGPITLPGLLKIDVFPTNKAFPKPFSVHAPLFHSPAKDVRDVIL
jgi:hypothetical protein